MCGSTRMESLAVGRRDLCCVALAVIVWKSYLNRDLASLEGFEPPTRCLEGSRSIL